MFVPKIDKSKFTIHSVYYDNGNPYEMAGYTVFIHLDGDPENKVHGTKITKELNTNWIEDKNESNS